MRRSRFLSKRRYKPNESFRRGGEKIWSKGNNCYVGYEDHFFISGFYFTGVAVICTHYAMEIIITRILQPHLLINSLHLLDPTCKVFYSNDTYAFLRAPLEGCDTEQTTSEDYFIYVNTMMGDAKSSNSSDLITREGRVQFKFKCSYRRIHVLSIVSFSPRRKVVRTSEGE